MARFFTSRFWGTSAAVLPPPPTLTLVDNADGTGAVATVAGGAVAAVNTLYVQPFSGVLGAGSWTSQGSRTGDGAIAVSLTTSGHYFAQLKSATAGGTSASA